MNTNTKSIQQDCAIYRAQWLHDHKAPSDWLIVTQSEIAEMREALKLAHEAIATLGVAYAEPSKHSYVNRIASKACEKITHFLK